MSQLIPVTLIALALAVPAFAKDKTPTGAADTDQSGTWSFEELATTWTNLTRALFDSADANGDGMLTAVEMKALHGSARSDS